MTATELITRVYIGYFDRVPDTAGMDYWLSQYNSGTPIDTIIGFFASATETTDLYGDILLAQQQLDTQRVESFINAIYQNLFGRAAESGGLSYWSSRLTGTSEQPQISLEDAILTIIQGAQNDDLAIMTNKVEAGIAALEFMRKQGEDLPLVTLRAIMDTITADPDSVDTALGITTEPTPFELPISLTLEPVQEDQPLVLTLETLETQLGVADALPNTWTLASLSLLTDEAGSISQNADGHFEFVPSTDWFGNVALEAEVATESGTHILSLTLSVLPVNDAPTARHDFVNALANKVLGLDDTPNLLNNDSDPEADFLIVSAVNGDAEHISTRAFGNNGGAFVINEDGSFTFDPMGDFKTLLSGETKSTSVTYEIMDSKGETDTASVSITVQGTYIPAPEPIQPEEPVSPETPTTDPTQPSSPVTDEYNIEFNFDAGAQAYANVFEAAASKLEAFITLGLPDTTHFDEVIDDLLINASVVSIDGVGGVLGQAGPDFIRADSRLPYLGSMEFDSSDMADMAADGSLAAVIVHEMLHVLGIGTLWDDLGLRSGANYIGTNAVEAYQNLAGNNSLTSIPLTTGVGPGSDYSHWDENIFNNELMTPFINAGNNPMSVITAGALEDLGYSVNYSAADSYSLFG